MSTRRLMAVGLLLALVLAGVVSGLASGHPDGLEHVAAEHDFARAGAGAAAASPLADYPAGWGGPVGCAVVLALVLGVMRVTTAFTRR